jgi:DNA-directed RNA polymerase subunit RPC12/RpoP
MFEYSCIDCPTRVTFAERPGDAVCPGCGLRLYVTADGQLGRYLPDDWRPGGIQGDRRPPGR